MKAAERGKRRDPMERAQTGVAVRLQDEGWDGLAQVGDGRGGVSHYRLTCSRCGRRRELEPEGEDVARVPDDWGPGHRCLGEKAVAAASLALPSQPSIPESEPPDEAA